MKSSAVIATITGFSCGSVIVRKRCQAVAPSTAAASCSSSWIDCSPASSATVVWGMPAQTPTTITAGSAQLRAREPVDVLARQVPAAQQLVEHARLRLEEELPHDPDDDRGHRPGDERQRAGEPATAEVLAQQEREPEREDELKGRDGHGPDQADLERVDEKVVVQQLAEVVEPDEVRLDVEPGPRVREPR